MNVDVEDSVVTDESALFGQIAETPAQFPGGGKKLMEFIASNLKLPESMNDGPDVHGRVIVSFTVQEDGSIDDVRVIRSVYPDLDEEAVRVVKLLPNFIPATVNGKPVKSKYTLPVTFRLQYAMPYLTDKRTIHRVGVNFSSEKGTIDGWKEE